MSEDLDEPVDVDEDCLCDWPSTCGGTGHLICDGCGGDFCICTCGGESECFGCPECPDADDYDDLGRRGLTGGSLTMEGASMNILALDLATHTGWCFREGDRMEHGVQIFDVKRGESPGMRYIRFNRWLDEFTWDHGRRRVELIVFEQAHHRGGAATEVAAGFSTRVLECAARHGIEHGTVHTATLKKFVTGKGNAKKPEMVAAVQRRWAPAVTDDNECDAIALLQYALEEMVPYAAARARRAAR